MGHEGYRAYSPLNTLKLIAADMWIVDAPEVCYGFMGLQVPCPTRMTLVRLPQGSLWVHSPTELTPSLAVEVDALGPVRYIVAPNTLHYVFLQDWKARFPAAEVFAVPRLEQSAKHPVPDHRELDDVAPDDWADVMRQIVVSSRSFSEACFFHVPTRTLILTDLIGSFELDRVRSPFVRFFLKRGG